MTIRPRYTVRAKARDMRELVTAAARAARILAGAVAPLAYSLTVAVRGTAARILTAHYTDPQEKS